MEKGIKGLVANTYVRAAALIAASVVVGLFLFNTSAPIPTYSVDSFTAKAAHIGIASLHTISSALAEGGDGGGDGGGAGDGGTGDGGGCCGSGGDTGGGEAPAPTPAPPDQSGSTPPPPPPPPPVIVVPLPVCTSITANPTSITAGHSSVISWSASGASSASISSGIGAVNPAGGSVTVTPVSNTTYVLTLSNAAGSVSCQTSVTVIPPPVDVCPNIPGAQSTIPAGHVLDASGNCVIPHDECPNVPGIQDVLPPGYVKDASGNCIIPFDACPNIPGDQSSIPAGYIVDQYGNCVIPHDVCPNIPGDQDVIPAGYIVDQYGNCVIPHDVCPNLGGNQDSVPSGYIIDQNGNCVPPPPSCTYNCGGGYNPPNVSLFRQPTEQPLTFVTLSQLPYTGYEASPTGIALFWLFLVLWSAGAAYLIAVKRFPMNLVEMYAGAGTVGSFLPNFGSIFIRPHTETLPHITAEDTHVEPMTHVSAVRPSIFASTMTMPRPAASPMPAKSVTVQTQRTLAKEDTSTARTDASTLEEKSDYVEAVPLFVGWVARGESDKAFEYIRTLHLTQKSAQNFMEEVVCELDSAYRSRLNQQKGVNAHTAKAVAHLSNDQIEKLIEALSTAVDRSYGSDYTSAKIALVKALGAGKSVQNETPVSTPAAAPVEEPAVAVYDLPTDTNAEVSNVTYSAPIEHVDDDFIAQQIAKNRR